MAIDTAAKRFRILDFDIPTAPGMPPPDGTIDASDRVAFLWLYMEAGAAAVVRTAIRTYPRDFNRQDPSARRSNRQ